MTEPLDHIERPSIPWRDRRETECGLPVDSYPTLTATAGVWA